MDANVRFDSDENAIFYVRPVAVKDLPDEIQKQAMGAEVLYSVHHESGTPVALMARRTDAFSMARDHDATMLSVH